MSDDEMKQLREQARSDRKLIRRAEQVLAEIDRGPGLSNEQADVLAALRIRLEGKPRQVRLEPALRLEIHRRSEGRLAGDRGKETRLARRLAPVFC